MGDRFLLKGPNHVLRDTGIPHRLRVQLDISWRIHSSEARRIIEAQLDLLGAHARVEFLIKGNCRIVPRNGADAPLSSVSVRL